MRFAVVNVCCVLLLLSLSACFNAPDEQRILVFTKTEGFRHGSIDAGIEALRSIGSAHGFVVDTTESAAYFTEDSLKRYEAVVFLNTSGDVLSFAQQADFERYVQAGGGFVGIHAAADTERDWPWYGGLVGAYFDRPLSDTARIGPHRLTVLDTAHPATGAVADGWERTDEWYRFAGLRDDAHVLVALEGEDEPFAWTHEYDGGRAFYTAGGHTPASFEEPAFRQHLEGGLLWVLGDDRPLDYERARTPRVPEENRFAQVVLETNLNEPTELELLGDGRLLYLQRRGAVKLYDPEEGRVRQIAELPVYTKEEDGLLGVAKDPGFAQNGWLYIYYSAPDTSVNRLSRFEMRGDSLLLASERVMLEVPVQRVTCCHTGGSVEFGPDGLLYLSTGDNTNPFESNGFAPIDDRPGREPFDARGSASNTNDLRGKILRIRPEADGTYTIPEGNLFVDDDPKTRPEIFVMGNRNPYRIAVDQKTGWLYWGEVGPDAGEDDPLRGPRGYDEVNQARQAGYFGWPLFIGDNKPYRDYDFATGAHGPAFDPAAPVNDSRNNTGLQELPPAQKAFIWYPYALSPEFPMLGSGGRTAMAGPVFYADAYTKGDHTFPAYYDGKLLIYEWMRGWIMAVTMDENGDLVRMEPFMPSTRFHNPSDMAFDENGVMWLLEYGTGWFTQNADARLSRIEYNPGNRPPVVQVAADTVLGAVPFTVRLTSAGTQDADGDALTYAWRPDEGGEVVSREPAATITYREPGVYRPTLTVTDAEGSEATASVEVLVGNAPPHVDLDITGNRSFYWDDTSITYRVSASDPEDGAVPPEQVRVQFSYLPQGFDQTEIAQGHQSAPEAPAFAEGLRLIEGSDCFACHKHDTTSIGPSYVAVAERYSGDDEAVAHLSSKIIEGGGGVWGEQAMAAHPQLTEDEAELMVKYILSLSENQPEEAGLAPQGSYALRAHAEANSREGTYILRAAYTDRGAGGVAALTSQDVVALRHPKVQAEHFDAASRGVGVLAGRSEEPSFAQNLHDGSFILFRDIDLTGVQQLTYGVRTMPLHDQGGVIELRLDAPDGPVVSTATVSASPGGEQAAEIAASLQATEGVHDLYFVARNPGNTTGNALFLLDWIHFLDRVRS